MRVFLSFLLHLGQYSCLKAHLCSSFLSVTLALGSDNVASPHCPPGMVSWCFKALDWLSAPPSELHSQQIHHWDDQFPGLNSLPLTPSGLFSCMNPKKSQLTSFIQPWCSCHCFLTCLSDQPLCSFIAGPRSLYALGALSPGQGTQLLFIPCLVPKRIFQAYS